ncbi:MAG: hypothetical protein ACJ74T_20455 [Pyrinomonadaceae bacterium]
MSSSKTHYSRAAGSKLRRLHFVTAALLLFLAAHAAVPSAYGQAASGKLIVTAAGVRLRERPETAAAESGRLTLGTVVEDLRGSNPVYEVPPADRANFRRSLAALRAQLALVPAAKKARVLGQLDAIAPHFR